MERKLPDDVATTWDIIEASVDLGNNQNLKAVIKKLIRAQQNGPRIEKEAVLLFRNVIFLQPDDLLKYATDHRFLPELTPKPTPRDTKNPVSIPHPDLTYAYEATLALTQEQQSDLLVPPHLVISKGHLLTFPVLVVEFKGNKPIWQATNKCHHLGK
ncbi:hypothetical protein GGR53DRAFT_466649 [Hypoxylon sp. FL1150]|nr:hypothetical protein GGR53DRAFT_466649 [Hypoxylon sp. FL1150]